MPKNFIKNVRNFKRSRGQTPKPEIESMATPFHSAAISSGNLSVTNLWKPLMFTVGVSTKVRFVMNVVLIYNISLV